MALLGIASFDIGNLGEAISSGGGVSISSSVQYSGHNSFKCLSTASGTAFAEFGTFTAGKPAAFNNATTAVTVRWRFAQKPLSGTEEVIVFRHATAGNKISVRLTSTSILKLVTSAGADIGFGTTALSPNQWYLLELSCGTGTNAPYTLKIDGVTELSGTVTLSASNTTTVRLGKTTNLATQIVEYYFSQLIIDSSTLRGANAGVAVLYPNANTGSAEWSAGTNTPGYLEVDDVSDDGDTTYIAKSAAASQTSQFEVIDSGAAGVSGTVLGLYAHARARTTAGTSATLVRFRQGSSNADSTAKALGTSYESLFSFVTTNPDTGSAFTAAELNSAIVGVIDTAAISTVRCTSLSVAVAFVASSGTAHAIAGAIDAAAAVTGAAGLTVMAAGNIAGSGQVSATASVSRALLGSLVASAADITATLRRDIAAGPAVFGGVSVITGILDTAAILPLAGSLAVSSDISGIPSIAAGVSGILLSAGALSGALGVERGAVAAATSQSTLDGSISVELHGEGSIAAIVVTGGELTVILPITETSKSIAVQRAFSVSSDRTFSAPSRRNFSIEG